MYSDVLKANLIVIGKLETANVSAGDWGEARNTMSIESVIKGELPKSAGTTHRLPITVFNVRRGPGGALEVWGTNEIDNSPSLWVEDARNSYIWALTRTAGNSDSAPEYAAGPVQIYPLVYEKWCRAMVAPNAEAAVEAFVKHPDVDWLRKMQYTLSRAWSNFTHPNSFGGLSTEDPVNWMLYQSKRYLELLQAQRLQTLPPAVRAAQLYDMLEARASRNTMNVMFDTADLQEELDKCGSAGAAEALARLKKQPHPGPQSLQSVRMEMLERLGKVKYAPSVPYLADCLRVSREYYLKHLAEIATNNWSQGYLFVEDDWTIDALGYIGGAEAQRALETHLQFWNDHMRGMGERFNEVSRCKTALETLKHPWGSP